MITHFCTVCNKDVKDPLAHMYTRHHQEKQMLKRGQLAIQGSAVCDQSFIEETVTKPDWPMSEDVQ